MKTYSIIKRNYGVEMNNANSKMYATKEEAVNAGNEWLSKGNPFLTKEDVKGWNFEVVENTENGKTN